MIELLIMHTHVHSEIEISLDEAKHIYETSVKLGKGKAFPNLFTTQKFALPAPEVRDFLISPKRLSVATADAFVRDTAHRTTTT